MSSFNRLTQHPINKDLVENADWIDDYFGNHNYGVFFKSTGEVFRADNFIWKLDINNVFCPVKQLTPSVEVVQMKDKYPLYKMDYGKEIEEVKNEDGSQDVNIKVSRLNLENRTAEDTIAETKIIEALSKKEVLVIIIDKKTNDFARFMSPLSEVRSRVERVIKIRNADAKDYLILEVEEDKSVRLSQL